MENYWKILGIQYFQNPGTGREMALLYLISKEKSVPWVTEIEYIIFNVIIQAERTEINSSEMSLFFHTSEEKLR